MGNLGNFNSAEIEPNNMNYDPLPAGKYLARVTESEVVTTSKGGEMLKLTFTVDEKGYESRRVWTNLNIVNDSEKAQQIALGMLSALCRAVGKVGVVSDSSMLHEKPLLISVGIEPGTTQYPEPRNKVTGFYPAKDFADPVPQKEGTRVKGRKNIKEAVEATEEAPEEELPDFLK